MPRLKGTGNKSAPKYRHHKSSGQAAVTISGKVIYLGKFSSKESRQRYKQAITDLWNAPKKTPKVKVSSSDVTISTLAAEFAKLVVNKHGEDSPEWKYQVRPVLKTFEATFGLLTPCEFGPIRFENYRQSWIDEGLSRQVVKRKSNYIIRMFDRGVALELIPVELTQRLKTLGPVETTAKPKTKRWSVDREIVKTTQAELTPLLADMVEVQYLIGARPSEVCNMRLCDIDRSSDVWVYTPRTHKTQHHGHSRSIRIGPKAQIVLAKYLLRDSKAFCFTPSEAYEQHYQRRRERRKTPENYGNSPQPKKSKSFKPCYDHNSYRRAIQRAAERAYPVPEAIGNDQEAVAEWKERFIWSPNQLRKSAATKARKEMGLETAQVVLGHASKKTTERHYAEVDNSRAIEFARKFG